jgi:protein phosphatase
VAGLAGRDLSIPDPALVVLIGAAGAGKSTFARRHFAADEVISSDALRAQISGDEADQSVSRVAFAILHRAVARRLASRRLTVVDATNVRAYARRALVARARAAAVPAVAIVLDLPPSAVRGRNAGRAQRVVADEVIAAQLAELAMSLLPGGLEREGFQAVHVIGSEAELDAVRIVRRA